MDIVEQIDKINRQLTVNGYKLTPQREITLKVLLENESDHLSAEDVFMLVRQKFPEIGLATVYRTLELLAELHIVQKMNFGDGVARFDLRQEGHDHMHHHLVCKVCGALEEIQDDWLLELEQRVASEYGFKVTDHRLDFMGVYQTCKHDSKTCKRTGKAVS
ncbi:transcriptional repressor [Cohnella sp. CIP 111063]|uniref:ferric iron uptake transcriptional regulator n=1 Tax=unclassified Cohnella TaxID=2636738 RepID=UPI000B8BD947|nr:MULTISPECIES: transcriptional repressor [unclassified Cohnella]OXS54470.1 transcriptional repressor [Cohnella sp. CIP 111063]PRX63972.1 Fur family ferric uptake transcriptional regulator [Cohnella sp. SGD-V74]